MIIGCQGAPIKHYVGLVKMNDEIHLIDRQRNIITTHNIWNTLPGGRKVFYTNYEIDQYLQLFLQYGGCVGDTNKLYFQFVNNHSLMQLVENMKI